jgi:hypothetical protein
MEKPLKEIVYSANVVEFVTVANEYCSFAERITEFSSADVIDKSVKLLSLLYLKALLLPKVEQINEEENEKFVTEFDWLYIRNGIEAILEDKDKFLDFFDSDMNETPEPVTYSIAENMADIYQDLKDFLEIYKLGNEDLSNDAIFECLENFKHYWGYRLVNTLRILHHLYHKGKEDEHEIQNLRVKREKDKWFISKAQQDFQKNDESI